MKIALTVQDAITLSQTPFSLKNGVSINNAAIGNMRVPNKDTSKERIGLSSAVK